MNKLWNQLEKIKSSLSFSFKSSTKVILTAVFLIAAAGLFFLSHFNFQKTSQASSGGNEIAEIKSTNILIDQVAWYKKLIERVGPSQAQDDLLNSGLPFTGQTHLLNHEVGDYLYQNFGVSGLSQCKEYFLASCYHGFVLDAIATGGIPEVAKVMDACQPQGPAVYQQCAHAVGHGFLAYIGYKNLTQALTMCDQMVTSVSDFPTFNCQDGVFMENIWALHDGGGPSPDRWVKDSDPVYPCDDKRIDPKYLLACWSNQPSLMYQQFNGDISKVADQCAKVTPDNLEQMCYNGLARQIHPIAAGDINQTFNLCGELGSKWSDYCVVVNDEASFAVGDRSLPFAICDRIDASSKDDCYEGLIGMIGIYAKSPNDRSSWCDKIVDQTWRDSCKKEG